MSAARQRRVAVLRLGIVMSAQKTFWSEKNGGCALHDRPNATFGCGECLKELPGMRNRIDAAASFLESTGFHKQAQELRGSRRVVVRATKLTKAQRDELVRLADPYPSMSFGEQTCRALERRGLARRARTLGGVVYRITDAGRDAIRGDK